MFILNQNVTNERNSIQNIPTIDYHNITATSVGILRLSPAQTTQIQYRPGT